MNEIKDNENSLQKIIHERKESCRIELNFFEQNPDVSPFNGQSTAKAKNEQRDYPREDFGSQSDADVDDALFFSAKSSPVISRPASGEQFSSHISSKKETADHFDSSNVSNYSNLVNVNSAMRFQQQRNLCGRYQNFTENRFQIDDNAARIDANVNFITSPLLRVPDDLVTETAEGHLELPMKEDMLFTPLRLPISVAKSKTMNLKEPNESLLANRIDEYNTDINSNELKESNQQFRQRMEHKIEPKNRNHENRSEENRNNTQILLEFSTASSGLESELAGNGDGEATICENNSNYFDGSFVASEFFGQNTDFRGGDRSSSSSASSTETTLFCDNNSNSTKVVEEEERKNSESVFSSKKAELVAFNGGDSDAKNASFRNEFIQRISVKEISEEKLSPLNGSSDEKKPPQREQLRHQIRREHQSPNKIAEMEKERPQHLYLDLDGTGTRKESDQFQQIAEKV